MTGDNRFEARAISGLSGTWTFSFDPEALTLTDREGEPSFRILREDADRMLKLLESIFTESSLFVRIDKQKSTFRLDKAQVAVLNRWLGKPSVEPLERALQRHLRWGLPIGGLLVIVSVPLPANPEAGIEAVPADALLASVGISLVAIWVLARIHPRRVWFLIACLWFLVAAAKIGMDILHGDAPLWGILILFLLLGSATDFQLWRRYAPEPQGED